jgi:hypothetical protein
VSPGAKNSLLAVGALALVGLFAGRAMRPPRVRRNPRGRRRRRDNPWVTLKNRHRVLIDDEGRIEAGELPRYFQGSHVGDVAELGRRWREIDHEEDKCREGGGRRARATFRDQDEVIAELYEANPHLLEFIESEAKGQSERTYQAWVRRGRRGPKPTRAAGDGRFDAINEGLERRGRRAVASWSEALRAIVPSSRRWEDLPPRLELLEDATGLRLNLPAPAEGLELGGMRGQECEQLGEGARERLLDQARTGRLMVGDLADVPF